MAEISAVTGLITGRVQGIGYRWFVERTATDLGLTGWVKNLPDGSVETQAEGGRQVLEQFIEILKTGHHGAIVRAIKTDWTRQDRKYFDSFEIRY